MSDSTDIRRMTARGDSSDFPWQRHTVLPLSIGKPIIILRLDDSRLAEGCRFTPLLQLKLEQRNCFQAQRETQCGRL